MMVWSSCPWRILMVSPPVQEMSKVLCSAMKCRLLGLLIGLPSWTYTCTIARLTPSEFCSELTAAIRPFWDRSVVPAEDPNSTPLLGASAVPPPDGGEVGPVDPLVPVDGADEPVGVLVAPFELLWLASTTTSAMTTMIAKVAEPMMMPSRRFIFFSG